MKSSSFVVSEVTFVNELATGKPYAKKRNRGEPAVNAAAPHHHPR